MELKKTAFIPAILFITFCLSFTASKAQLPNPSLVGYWQNWNDVNSPYIDLTSIDSRYNVIEVSFAVPQAGTSYQMVFDPQDGGVTQAAFISKIQTVKAQGKKVLISIGGGGVHVSLDNASEKASFISSMNSIIDTYGFDGIDIDFEGTSLSVSGGTITAPVDAPIINLIDAIKQIMQHHRSAAGTKLLLTMAPETVFVQGAMSSYGGDRGAYLPVIHALRDSIDLLQVQLYNSGNVYGIDGGIYDQATTDFIVAMSEAVIQGFNTAGGTFTGLPASKVAVGLPACDDAAPGGGFLDTLNVKKAMLYLMGSGPKPGSYTLQQAGGYPSLRGMMTWSVNWDVLATCASANEYAVNFQRIFNSPNVWTGAISNAWENPANWSKNVVPDSNTNVIINSGNVMLNSNGFCKTITISSTAHLTVNINFILTITH
jgi:chitinase